MDPRWKKALPGALALVLFVLLVGRSVRELARHPALNWDMLPAMALALEWEVDEPVELHRRTYEAAREELPAPVYQELTARGVREARARDPLAFHEHLPFYRARVLYSLGVYALHAAGSPLSAATFRVPLIAYALCALLFLAWMARHLPLWLAALAAFALACTPALLTQAQVSSADALATLLTCLGAWALLERRSFPLAAACLTLAIGARPDAVILVGFLAGALVWLVPREERPGLGALGAWSAVSAVAYLGVQRFAGEYGWWPVMQISFIGKTVHPAELPTAVDWGVYGEILASQLGGLPGNGYTVTPGGNVTGSTLVAPYAALALGLCLLALRRGRRVLAALLAALLATYLLRWFLFPQLWDRFYAPFYALVPLCLVALLGADVLPRRAEEPPGNPVEPA